MQDVLKAAVALHQSGRLAEAAPLYQQVLAADASNAEAMHLLGVLHHQQGGARSRGRADRTGGGLEAQRCGISRQPRRGLSSTRAV